MMGTLFRDPKEGEPDRQTIGLTKIVCGPSESHLVMLQLERYKTHLVLYASKSVDEVYSDITVLLCQLIHIKTSHHDVLQSRTV